jgi:hypothetical protein
MSLSPWMTYQDVGTNLYAEFVQLREFPLLKLEDMTDETIQNKENLTLLQD